MNPIISVGLACTVCVATSAFSQEYLVPPPDSPQKNTATLNVVEGIEAIRSKGLTREAEQLDALLKAGRVLYRTSGPHMYDAQFIHSTLPGGKDTLYFGVQHLKHVQGQGVQRFDNTNHRYLHVFILSALHEMVHKDQSRTSILLSVERGKSRGYSLHEIEAYRASYKKYTDHWITSDINAYLAQRSTYDDNQNADAVNLLRDKLFPLKFGLEDWRTRQYHGDHACRWRELEEAVKSLDDKLIALYLDHTSKNSCKTNREEDLLQQQAAIETNLLCRQLKELIRTKETEVAALNRTISERRSDYTATQRLLSHSREQSERLRLATRVATLNTDLTQLQPQLTTRQQEKTQLERRLTDAKANYTQRTSNYPLGQSNYHRCRLQFINQKITELKLTAAQIPPDMELTNTGQANLVNQSSQRNIDIAASVGQITASLNIQTDLKGVIAAASSDPRTPCGTTHTNVTPAGTTQPDNVTHTIRDLSPDPVPVANAETIPTDRKSIPLTYSESKVVETAVHTPAPKKECRGGGLAGRINCDVTAKIEGSGPGTSSTVRTTKVLNGRVTLVLAPYVRQSSMGCLDDAIVRVAVVSVTPQFDPEIDAAKIRALEHEAYTYAQQLRAWKRNLSESDTKALQTNRRLSIDLGTAAATLQQLKGAPTTMELRLPK